MLLERYVFAGYPHVITLSKNSIQIPLVFEWYLNGPTGYYGQPAPNVEGRTDPHPCKVFCCRQIHYKNLTETKTIVYHDSCKTIMCRSYYVGYRN
jgi:hypothetical protein